jgi:hypothetical protein
MIIWKLSLLQLLQGICLFSKTSTLALEPTEPPVQWVSYLGIKQFEFAVGQSSLSSAEVKNEWGYVFAPTLSL